jgi:hypothetical protein
MHIDYTLVAYESIIRNYVVWQLVVHHLAQICWLEVK